MDEPLPYIISQPAPLPDNFGDGLVEIDSPADGSCYFHSVLNDCFRDYRLGVHMGNKISQKQMVRLFREELADFLAQESESGGPVYDGLMNGEVKKFATDTGIADYSLEGMQRALRSNFSVGYEFHGLVSDVVKKDIYVLTVDRKKWALETYVLDAGETLESYYKNRPSIVILSEANHYKSVARLLPEGGYQTTFAVDDPLIFNLSQRIGQLKKRQPILALKKIMPAQRKVFSCPAARARITIRLNAKPLPSPPKVSAAAPARVTRLKCAGFSDPTTAKSGSGLFEAPDANLKLSANVGFKQLETEEKVNGPVGFQDKLDNSAIIPSVAGFHDQVSTAKRNSETFTL